MFSQICSEPVVCQIDLNIVLLVESDQINCTKPCQNGGKCIGKDKCACAAGYHGDVCEAAVCDPGCGDHGDCNSPGNCTCHAGWTGDGCSVPVCDTDCWGRGVCVAPNK